MIKARNNSYKNDRQARTKNSSSREETKKVEESKSSVVIRDEEDNHSDDDNIDSDHSDHEVKPPVVSVSKTSSRQKQQVAEEYDEEEEEEELPPPKKQQRPVTSNSSRGSRKQIRQEVEEEEQPKHVSRKQPRQEVDEEAPRDARRGSPRRNALVSRPTLVRLIQQSKLESVSSDVYNFMIEEMTRYVNEVVDVLAEENDGDECVIKESYLKFLGDRSKAQGILDVKTFEKIYNTVSSKATVNIEFSSGAFNTFAKYTEHHMIDFLEKASTLISTYGRKRLNVSDLELLKSLLK
jgi:histone H3/H4